MLAAAGAEPYEMTEYQGMADFPWATSSVVDARKLAEALKVVCQRPEVVLLRIISLVDDVESIHKGRTRYQALDAPSRPKIKSDCNGAGATSPSRMNRQVAESDEENDAEVFAQGCGECNTRCCVCCEAGDIGYPYTQFPCPLCK